MAQSWGPAHLKAGDVILATEMEHHSNLVPWQRLAARTGATLRLVPVVGDDAEHGLDLDALDRLLTPQVKLFAFTHISNTLGTINPAAELCARARQVGALTVVDAAQSAGHEPLDVRALGCDFLAFSGHKMAGPTGIGVLYGKEQLLEEMPPWQGGGDMIRSVTFEKTTYNDLPYKFEAGTPDIAGVIGLGAAIDYLDQIGMDAVAAHEHDLLEYGTRALESISGLRLIGTARKKAGVLSFVIDGVHPHDAGTILDREGVAVRAGHHCAQPVMDRFGVSATTRASLAFYNTKKDIDALVAGIQKVKEIFAV